jgi:hypothetical protein
MSVEAQVAGPKPTSNDALTFDLADESSTAICHFSYCGEPDSLTF